MMNIATNAMANFMATVKRISPDHMVAIQLKIFTPVGMAMSIVIVEKIESATAPMPYNAAASGGSNQGPLNPALADAVKARVEALRAADPGNTAPVPVDLVTASASGLDPHISLAAAQYQAGRVARARNLPVASVNAVIGQHAEQPLWGLLGEPRVNVLALNLALDSLR